MSVPVPFGQFVPGESAVHRLDPRVKIVTAILYATVLFTADGWVGLAVAGVAGSGMLALSRVPIGLALRGLRPVAFLLTLTLLVNGLRWQPESALFRLGPVAVDGVGLSTGAFFASRMVLLVVGTSLLTLTTSPVALTDALSRLMKPLRVVRVPVDDVAMMFSIALRFIPTTAEEADRLIVAQTSRGAVFDQGGPIRRAKAWLPVLVPLFVNLFRRADALAIAMESRCYTGVGRTRLNEPSMRTVDWATLVGGVLISAAVLIALS